MRKKLRVAAASSDPTVGLEYLASGETQDWLGSVLVQKSGQVDDDAQFSKLGAFYEMDGRKSRYIGEVLNWCRREDAGDLKGSELNELVEKLQIWQSNQKIVMSEELVKNNVMNDELVQTCVMNQELMVQTCVMNAKIVPKVEMGSVLFQNWWLEQFATQH